MSLAVRRYSEALLDIAFEEKCEEEVYEQFKFFYEQMKTDEQFERLMTEKILSHFCFDFSTHNMTVKITDKSGNVMELLAALSNQNMQEILNFPLSANGSEILAEYSKNPVLANIRQLVTTSSLFC